MPTPVGADLETQLAVAQANLDLLEAHFQATIEQLPIGIAHADFDDRITRFNSAFCAMLGRTAEELRGRLFAEITYPDDKDGSAAALKRLDARELTRRGAGYTLCLDNRQAHGRGG